MILHKIYKRNFNTKGIEKNNKFVIIKGAGHMYEIVFYEDNKGKSIVLDYLNELKQKSDYDKNSRINFNKIVAYLDLLQEFGTRMGEPFTKHINGDIWELRPMRNRILYAALQENRFIVLHCFIKKTQKTPEREIEKAKRNFMDYLERKQKNGIME